MIKSDITVSIQVKRTKSNSSINGCEIITIEKPSRYLGGVGWRLIIEEAQLQ